MPQGHEIDHIIYNDKFFPIIEEFKQLILKDKDIEIHCTHNLGRFSTSIRLLIIEYVTKKSKNEKLKQYVKELLELPTIKGYDNKIRKTNELLERAKEFGRVRDE
ncbi:MAG: hypothetical protein AABY32_05700 [Nanoarchaeota archaeon]